MLFALATFCFMFISGVFTTHGRATPAYHMSLDLGSPCHLPPPDSILPVLLLSPSLHFLFWFWFLSFLLHQGLSLKFWGIFLFIFLTTVLSGSFFYTIPTKALFHLDSCTDFSFTMSFFYFLSPSFL